MDLPIVVKEFQGCNVFFFNTCNVGIVRVCPWHRIDKKKNEKNSCFTQTAEENRTHGLFCVSTTAVVLWHVEPTIYVLCTPCM